MSGNIKAYGGERAPFRLEYGENDGRGWLYSIAEREPFVPEENGIHYHIIAEGLSRKRLKEFGNYLLDKFADTHPTAKDLQFIWNIYKQDL